MAMNKKPVKTDFDDIFYAGTKTLINNFGEKDAAKLALLERDFVNIASIDARLRPLKGDFDLAHMKQIHEKIFGEVYPWAGQTRQYPIFKNRPDGLVTEFARPDEILNLDKQLKSIIAETKGFTSLKPNEVPAKLARVYQIANEMHPFREGNGRTQRIYLDYLAEKAGFKLDFKAVSKEAWNYAASTSGKVAIGGGERIDGRIDELDKLFKHITKAIEIVNAYSQGRVEGKTATQANVMTLADLNPKLAAERKASYRVR